MAIPNLPRPWLLAALADVPVTMLAQHDANVSDADADREHHLPRPEARRRRLSVRQFADQRPHEVYGEDYWQGADPWA